MGIDCSKILLSCNVNYLWPQVIILTQKHSQAVDDFSYDLEQYLIQKEEMRTVQIDNTLPFI